MTIGVHRSFFLSAAVFVVHGAAIILLFLPAWPLLVPVCATLALLISGVYSWCRCNPQVVKLRLLVDGRLQCRCLGAEEFHAAELLPGATVHPALTLLRLVCNGRKLSVVLLPDSALAEDRRHLRVWLRWRASFGQEENVNSDFG